MNAFFCVMFGYFIGTINSSYILGKLKGFDIRQKGSGNAGASNAVLMMGKAAGAVCALFDISKAYVACRVAKSLFPALYVAGILAGAACILGHIFPVWMNFRGGKGLACLGGTVLAYDGQLFCVLLLLEILLVLLVDYVCAVAMSGAVIFPVLYAVRGGEVAGILALLVVAAVMLYKHIENIQRILQGKEARVSYLWNREKEIERLHTNE